MKVLLFTHAQDIDGLGNVILAKRAFTDVDYILCKTFEITDKFKERYYDGSIYNYDLIIVTDLCIKEPMLEIINADKRLENKIIILDHHKSEIDEGNDKYPFVNIIVEKNGKKECGTSLFYNYLLDNNYLSSCNIIDELVEWTRQYDVWDWEVNNNYDARKLHILFESLGADSYIKIVENMLDKYDKVTFDEDNIKVINGFENNLKHDINEILTKMLVEEITIDGVLYRIGFVKCPYKYRNDISAFVKADNVNIIDTLGMIMTDIDTVSYRTVNDIDASKIAVYFGGKGHKAAASNPQNNDKFKYIIEKYNKEMSWQD